MLGSVVEAATRASMGDWLLLLAGVLLVLYIAGTWNYDFFRRRGVPSSSPKLPFSGDFVGAFTGMKAFNDAVRDAYRRGDGHGVFGVFELHRPVFLIRDPEMIKVFAVKEFDNFMNRRSIVNEQSEPIFAKNLANLRDQQWRDMRATLSPAFTTSKLKVMLPLICECAQQLAQHLRRRYAASAEGAAKRPLPVDMKDIFSRVANDVIATAAFGVSCDSLKEPENTFYRMGKQMTTFSLLRSFRFFGYIVVPKLMEAFGIRLLDKDATNFFDSLVHETIRERRKRGIFRPDMLQLLMQAREGQLRVDAEDSAEAEKVGASKTKLLDDDISAQAVIFFFAGFETISLALSFTTHILSHRPDIQKRLREEVATAMKETGGKLTYETVQGMKYLDAVINEVLRFYSPAGASDRVCQKDTAIPAGATSPAFTMKKGDLVFIPIIGLHHDPQYWEEPEKFDPERFSDENKHKITPFTYMPFGVGPRICIGQRFALVEVKFALAYLLMDFDLHPCAKTKHPIQLLPGATIKVKGGFWCGLTPRDT